MHIQSIDNGISDHCIRNFFDKINERLWWRWWWWSIHTFVYPSIRVHNMIQYLYGVVFVCVWIVWIFGVFEVLQRFGSWFMTFHYNRTSLQTNILQPPTVSFSFTAHSPPVFMCRQPVHTYQNIDMVLLDFDSSLHIYLSHNVDRRRQWQQSLFEQTLVSLDRLFRGVMLVVWPSFNGCDF